MVNPLLHTVNLPAKAAKRTSGVGRADVAPATSLCN